MIPEQPLESHSGLCHHAGGGGGGGGYIGTCALTRSHMTYFTFISIIIIHVLYKKLQDDNLALRVSIEPTS